MCIMAKITKVDFGEIVIGSKSFYSDVTIDAMGHVEHKAKSRIVDASGIAPLMKGGPECIVIGTGMDGSVGIEPEVEQILEDKGIKLFCDRTPNAADIFNGLAADGRKVAGIFHLTA
jgi:hypothetical protein